MKLVRYFRVACRRTRNFTYSEQFQNATLSFIDRGIPRLVVYGGVGLAIGMAVPVAEYREGFTFGAAAAMAVDASILAARAGVRRTTALAQAVAVAHRKRKLAQMRAAARETRFTAPARPLRLATQ